MQTLLDKSVPHQGPRWAVWGVLILLFAVRVYAAGGFYLVAYGLGIYYLNLLIAFLSPREDPELEGPALPTTDREEFRPFQRRLPEFKFWLSLTKGCIVALLLSTTRAFDVPVFWPVLLAYWLALFCLTMRRQIRHMIKHRYIPLTNAGKPRPPKQAPSSR